MDSITVSQAERIIYAYIRDYGNEKIPCHSALGRVLGENLYADRDLPPFNRSTVDGIAIAFSAFASGERIFTIRATQSAGEPPKTILQSDECIEIMTGAAVDDALDTVIRYEDIILKGDRATIKDVPLKKGQNIHTRGKDKKQGEAVVDCPAVITPAVLGVAASIGAVQITVRKLPKVIIITTGDEMVPVDSIPTPYQLRRSNAVVMQSLLQGYNIGAEIFHLEDDPGRIKKELSLSLGQYDVVLMSGGVSMGKFDYIPRVLEELKVEKLFHCIRQRPGKPFYFGSWKDKTLLFAFPGNPVSVFLCFHRYFIPWLEASLGISRKPAELAVLDRDISFNPPLQYFAQVRLYNEQGQLRAQPVENNGSGDFSNLVLTSAFMELPMEKKEFKKGEAYPIWRYKPNF